MPDNIGMNVSELWAEIKSLRALVDERDRWYSSRDVDRQKAIDAALTASDKLAKSIHDASEKAISVAEGNAEKWRNSANEWRGAMDDRETKFVLKPEFVSENKALHASISAITERWDSDLKGIRLDLQTLNTSLIESKSQAVGVKTSKDDSRSNIALLVSIASLFVAFMGMLAMGLWRLVLSKP